MDNKITLWSQSTRVLIQKPIGLILGNRAFFTTYQDWPIYSEMNVVEQELLRR